jgi:hypothetical protein
MLRGCAESPAWIGVSLDMMGGLGGLWMRGYGGAFLGNPRPIRPRMAKLGVEYYLYVVFWVMFICVMVDVSV